MESQKTSLTAVLALVFSVLCFPLGLILGIVGLVQIGKSNGSLGGKGLAIAGIVISLFVMIPGTGVVAAIAIPSFLKFGCKAKQAEAKTRLKTIAVGQQMYKIEHEKFASALSALPNVTDTTHRYTFTLTSSSADSFEVTATANDETLRFDTWTINDRNELINVKDGCD